MPCKHRDLIRIDDNQVSHFPTLGKANQSLEETYQDRLALGTAKNLLKSVVGFDI